MTAALSPLERPTGEYARRFVPSALDPGDWNALAPLFAELIARTPSTRAERERRIRDLSELLAVIGEERARRHIASARNTEDAELEQRYLSFCHDVDPKASEQTDAVYRKIATDPGSAELDANYGTFLRNIRNQVEIFRAENVKLEADLEDLGQDYSKRMGRMTVIFRGEEKTLAQLAPIYESTDRTARREAFEAASGRRLRERDALDDIFDAMLAKRREIAKNAGAANYRDFRFRQLNRFDYTPDDCALFHTAVEKVAVPVLAELRQWQKETLKLDALRPWDLSVDPWGRPPLVPFAQPAELEAGVGRIFERLAPELAAQFADLRGRGLLDVANRKGKRPGAFCYPLEESRIPFIFANAVGVDDDIRTLLHEMGHGFHAFASRTQELVWYRDCPSEFAEVASMSMELLGGRHLDVFYRDPEHAARSARENLEGIVSTFTWVATIDAFQHWIYTHPEHTRRERRDAWIGIVQRFADGVDWSGYEEVRGYAWHRQLHVFLYPFYYIEYAIAQIGALQVWLAARTDPARALSDYRRGLALGGSRPLPQLFAGAGLTFDVSEGMLRRLLGAVQEELKRLRDVKSR
ncbi:MAG: M3 family oligoendopeptidase [Planctomycetes bacterium]|nr:M3 family oligoendopeptidase [Planctomycetota bacterium]